MKHRNLIFATGMALPLLLPAGCAVTDDPNQGGFLGGLYGMTSGAYNRRLLVKQSQLGSAQQQAYYLESNNSRLGREAGRTVAERARLKQQLAALDARTAELAAQASHMQTDSDAQRRQRAELDSRLQQARADIARLKREVAENKTSLEATRRERASLEDIEKHLAIVSDALQ
jgi:chromosome segregation ATPase